jgi:hypothetical protein
MEREREETDRERRRRRRRRRKRRRRRRGVTAELTVEKRASASAGANTLPISFTGSAWNLPHRRHSSSDDDVMLSRASQRPLATAGTLASCG